MAKKLAVKLISIFSGLLATSLGKYIFIFVLSLIPVLELRGGLIAASLLDMNPWTSLLVCLVGNIIVIPIGLYLLEWIFDLLSKSKLLKKGINKWKKKALSKKSTIDKYGFFGLTLFVGIPLPGTGAWTGCLLAVLLGMDKKKSFLYILLGVMLAAVIMMIFSFGLLKGVID